MGFILCVELGDGQGHMRDFFFLASRVAVEYSWDLPVNFLCCLARCYASTFPAVNTNIAVNRNMLVDHSGRWL